MLFRITKNQLDFSKSLDSLKADLQSTKISFGDQLAAGIGETNEKMKA